VLENTFNQLRWFEDEAQALASIRSVVLLGPRFPAFRSYQRIHRQHCSTSCDLVAGQHILWLLLLRRALLRDVAWPSAALLLGRCAAMPRSEMPNAEMARDREFEREVIMDTCIGWLLLARRNRVPLRSFCSLYLFLSPICK